ncbi:glycosyltransferase [Dysgonomonas sp. 511]|uniref:glycosyltransferase n=1 Tax=Dysgonomonas sp. 511 TaxID=2302930 RepID=UPI0013D597C8|nr:glycosyltransferase [Dysgonomonas sp. 511]NDV79326.1 glycosyltransferase [Dysgonomonas sp. 511]
MRIFQVITVSEYGGAQTIVANLVEALAPEHELFILYGGNGEAWKKLEGKFTGIRLNDHRKGVSWKDLGLFFKLLYYRLKYKPDVIHLHSSKMGVLGRLAFSKKKTVYTVHGFDSVRKAYPRYLAVEKKLKDRAFRIVGVSRYDVEALAEEDITRNVALVYNGVSDVYHSHCDLYTPMMHLLRGIKKKYPKIVMCISRLSKQKKFDLFVDIAAQMPQYAFVWIGNKEPIEGMPANVFCLGETHAAHCCLHYADMFILPSNYEGLPMSMLEALAMEKPVVASAVGGIPEVLDGRNGFAVENTTENFCQKIEHILSDDKVQKSMSQHARLTYLSNFTVGKMIDGYLAIFNQIEQNNK